MKFNTIQQSAINSSRCGAPSHVRTNDSAFAGFGMSTLVRERAIVAFTDAKGFGVGYAPGTSVWRPPSS